MMCQCWDLPRGFSKLYMLPQLRDCRLCDHTFVDGSLFLTSAAFAVRPPVCVHLEVQANHQTPAGQSSTSCMSAHTGMYMFRSCMVQCIPYAYERYHQSHSSTATITLVTVVSIL